MRWKGKTSSAFKEGPTAKFVSTDAGLERTEFPSQWSRLEQRAYRELVPVSHPCGISFLWQRTQKTHKQKKMTISGRKDSVKKSHKLLSLSSQLHKYYFLPLSACRRPWSLSCKFSDASSATGISSPGWRCQVCQHLPVCGSRMEMPGLQPASLSCPGR